VHPCRCNEKADIFSYGVVLWEIITQEPPRRGHLRDLEVCSCTVHTMPPAQSVSCLLLHTLSKFICPQSFCQQFEIMPGYFPCQLACCSFPAAKMQHCEKHESPIWHHHNAWQHSLLAYMKGSLQVPQECPQEVADLVDACLDLCADRRPTADDITDVIYQSAQANSSVLEG